MHTPKGVTHTFKNVGGGPGRLLVIAVPADIEQFFCEIGQPVEASDLLSSAGPPPPEVAERVVAAAQRYGIEILPLHPAQSTS